NLLGLRRKIFVGRSQGSRMPRTRWPLPRQPLRDHHFWMDADDEKPRPRVRNEKRRIHHDSAYGVIRLLKGAADGRKILAFMRRKRAAYIFKNDQPGSAILLHQPLHEVPKRPKSSRTVSF